MRDERKERIQNRMTELRKNDERDSGPKTRAEINFSDHINRSDGASSIFMDKANEERYATYMSPLNDASH